MSELKIEEIVAPISEDKPCGNDVRNLDDTDSLAQLYKKTRLDRSSLRREERKILEEEGKLVVKSNEWQNVVESCIDLLASTKDIEIGAWLVEAASRANGFTGLAQSLNVLTQLIEKYGMDIFPSLEEGEDVGDKLSSISMFGGNRDTGTLVIPIYATTLIPTHSDELLNAWSVRQMLEESDGAKDLRSEILESIDEIKSVISVIDKAGFIQVEKDVLECEKAFEQFDSALSKVFSRHAPKLQQVSQSLTYCVSLVKGIKEIIQKREEEEARQAAAALAEKERLAALSEGGVGGSPAATSSLALESLSPDQLNKEQALSLLVVLSKFFKNSDPHSPIAYSLERIERWAKLSLPEMMLDIVSSDVMMSYCKITGVPFAKSGNEERDGDYYD